MSYSCLVYVANANPNLGKSDLIQMKDQDTRRYAKAQASGVRILGNGFVFEIIEAPGNTAEELLDTTCESPHIDDPEILLFSPLKARSFKSWMLVNRDSMPNRDTCLENLRCIALQAQESPEQIPQALTQMIALFQSSTKNDQTPDRSAA